MLNVPFRTRSGITRLQLLVVLAFIAVAIGILLPIIHLARDKQNRTQTENNLAECAKATHKAHDQFRYFPPFFGHYGPEDGRRLKHQASFFVHLLPYVGQESSYLACLDDPDNANRIVVPAYLAPSDYSRINEGVGSVNFAVNLRLWQTPGLRNSEAPQLGMSPDGRTTKVRMPATFNPDGVSNTLLFATKMQVCGANASTLINAQPTLNINWQKRGFVTNIETINGPYFGWTKFDPRGNTEKWLSAGIDRGWQPAPTSSDCVANASSAQSFHSKAIHVAMADASVRSISAEVSFYRWTVALTPNGGEEYGVDEWGQDLGWWDDR
jgi:type II secretory pathway pseudopilin PulG